MSSSDFPGDDYTTEELLELLDRTMDKVPMEEKLLMSRDASLFYLEPWEVQDIAQTAMSRLPEGLEDQVDLIFDVVYDAISEALERARNQSV